MKGIRGEHAALLALAGSACDGWACWVGEGAASALPYQLPHFTHHSPAGNYEVRVRQGLPVDPVVLHSGG